uniref:Tyrosine-protein kinase n=1 Tax=Panagrellus redivivus TaxID=6233 RepID=A0A7E4VED3_PANRE
MGLFDKVFAKSANKDDKKDDETRLESQPWYHGIRTRADIAEELREPGDYLVRASQTATTTTIVLNVMTKSGLSNYTIAFVHEKKKYCLHILIKEKKPGEKAEKVPEFDNIVELINYYKTTPLPCNNKLKKPVPRPAWLIKHTSIHYDPIADKIASGNFGSVYKGYYIKEGVQVKAAIKVTNQETRPEEPLQVVEARQQMMHEARLMSEYNHDNVITFYGVACDHPPIVLVMEYCPGDSLENHLLAERGDVVIERVLYCYEAARGMRYLHVQGCIHSDLASRNCLISAAGIIKIADFGLSKFVDELNPNTAKLKIPIRWMAPECFGRKAQIIQKSDVWAYGVLIYEIFNKGGMPWPDDKDFKGMAKRIRSGNMPTMPEITPPIIQKLVAKCWIVDPAKRTTFDDCYEFLSDYLAAHSDDFPPLEKFAVNKIPQVQRIKSFREDPPDARVIQKTARRLTVITTREEPSGEESRRRALAAARRNSKKPLRHKGVSKFSVAE